MSLTTIAGKPSNTIGEKDSTLVLRGSSIKIQWGNKFIDLIKNGKINSDSLKLLKTANSTEELTTDGIYLVEDSVWTVIGGTKILLSGDTTTYVSYLTELTDIDAEQKNRALTNIGFYYDTYELASNAGLTKGLIYVLGDNKLYVVQNGALVEYKITNSEDQENIENTLTKLCILDYSLMVDGEKYATLENNTITLDKNLIVKEGINSYGATSTYGFRLYMNNGKSYLEVDNLILRNLSIDVSTMDIQKVKYYLEENIILDINGEDSVTLTLLYSDKYKVGDILTTSVLFEKEILQGDDFITEHVLVPVDFIITSISGNLYEAILVSKESEIIGKNIQILKNKNIYYKLGQLPVARVLDHNYDMFTAGYDQTLENISTRIGSLLELKVNLTTKPISNYTKKDLGIYSDNAFLENSYLFNTNLYNTIFKNVNNIYPKYDEGWLIPENSNDLTIVTSLWVNNKIEPILTEINGIKESIESIEDLENRLGLAESDIDGLEKSVKDLEDSVDSLSKSIPDISGLTSDVSTLKTDVATIKTDVADLKNAGNTGDNTSLQGLIDELTSKVEELSLLPSVLISGNVFRDSADSLTWKFTGVVHPKFGMSTSADYNYIDNQTITTHINGGVLLIDWTASRRINIVACCANMQTSGLVTSSTEGEYISTDNDRAMYWLGTYANGGSTYVRAMTLQDNTAISYDELWGPVLESHNYGILSFSIIAIGYVF